MGSEAEKESSNSNPPKLPLFSDSHAIFLHMHSPERSGTLTPPLPYHATASVPFRWEEEPGKPKPCTALTPFSNPTDLAPKCLELPPRLLFDAKITKLSSPTTVLEGPYTAATGRAKFQSSSLRMGSECYGSFRATAGSFRLSPETTEMVQQQQHGNGAMVLSKRGYKEKGFLGSLRRGNLKPTSRREAGGNSYVFPTSVDRDREYIREDEENRNRKKK